MANNHSEPESTVSESIPRSNKFIGDFGDGITLTPPPDPKSDRSDKFTGGFGEGITLTAPKPEKKKKKD